MKFLLFPVVLFSFASCSNLTPVERHRIAAISNLALSFAETKGAISHEDASLIREAGTVILTEPAPATLPEVVVTK